MITLKSYFDDSSDCRREKYYACGGLLGSTEQWDWADGRWSYETRELNEPFRSTDCECQQGQFKDWPKSKCDELMARLVGVIRETKLYGFASIVPVESYKQAFPDFNNHDPFLLAVTQSIMNMAFLGDRINKDVGLWFENGPVVPSIAAVFESIRQCKWKPSRRLRGFRSESKELRPLQAADLVAREAFKHSDNLGVRSTRKPIVRLSDVLYFIRWTEKALEYLARNGGPKNIDLLSKWDECPEAPKLEMFWKKF